MLAITEPRYKHEKSSIRWSDERTAELTKLWNDGHSASQIASTIGGVTRNAVIGKVNRLGLEPRRTVVFIKTSNGLCRSNAPKPRITTVSPSLFSRAAPKLKTVPIPEPVAPSLEHKVDFFGLGRKHCRYPLWTDGVAFHDKFYCGSPQADMSEGRSYCAFHQSRMRPPQPQKGAA